MTALCVVFAAAILWQQPVFASSETETYQLHMEVPQVAQAANGDKVSITGSGVFSVNPKSTTATGTYTSAASGSDLGCDSASFLPALRLRGYIRRPSPAKSVRW
jgi:hypothetical protein